MVYDLDLVVAKLSPKTSHMLFKHKYFFQQKKTRKKKNTINIFLYVKFTKKSGTQLLLQLLSDRL